MTEYTGAGDQRRSMELLWGKSPAPTRGPKPGLSVEAIVAAAIELADADGLGAVSMRSVADNLGKSAMALYTYVPGKTELIELMMDAVLGEVSESPSLENGWKEAVEASARRLWAFYQRHPWILQVSAARALLSPHELDGYEAQLRLFDGLGLSGEEMNWCVSLVDNFVRGAAKTMSDIRAAEQVTGVSEDDWWYTRSALLDELSGDIWAERYPTITKLSEQQAFDQVDRPDEETPYLVQDALDTFEFGLQRLLDGIEAFIDSRRSSPPPAPQRRPA